METVYTETRCHAHCFSVFSYQTHRNALRTLSALVWFKVRVSESFHQVIFAELPYLSATETASTTWTFLPHMLLRVNNSAQSGGMTFPHSTQTQVMSPTEVDMAGRCVLLEDLTQEMKTEILSCPTSRCSFPRVHMLYLIICIGNFLASRGRVLREYSKSPSDLVSDRG